LLTPKSFCEGELGINFEELIIPGKCFSDLNLAIEGNCRRRGDPILFVIS
jgi:hypothetical protein